MTFTLDAADKVSLKEAEWEEAEYADGLITPGEILNKLGISFSYVSSTIPSGLYFSERCKARSLAS